MLYSLLSILCLFFIFSLSAIDFDKEHEDYEEGDIKGDSYDNTSIIIIIIILVTILLIFIAFLIKNYRKKSVKYDVNFPDDYFYDLP